MGGHSIRGYHALLPELDTTLATDLVIWKEAHWGQMRVGYETYLAEFDDAELLKGLPDDRCQCPHWGHVLAGRLIVRYADHEDEVMPGEAYYMAPGHTMAVDAGTVLLEFSPKKEFNKLSEIAEKNLARLQKEGAS